MMKFPNARICALPPLSAAWTSSAPRAAREARLFCERVVSLPGITSQNPSSSVMCLCPFHRGYRSSWAATGSVEIGRDLGECRGAAPQGANLWLACPGISGVSHVDRDLTAVQNQDRYPRRGAHFGFCTQAGQRPFPADDHGITGAAASLTPADRDAGCFRGSAAWGRQSLVSRSSSFTSSLIRLS